MNAKLTPAILNNCLNGLLQMNTTEDLPMIKKVLCVDDDALSLTISELMLNSVSFTEQIDCFLRLNKDARESATKINISLCRLFGYGYRPPAGPREVHRDHPAGPPDPPPAANPAGLQERAAPAVVPAPVPGWIPPPPRARADRRPP